MDLISAIRKSLAGFVCGIFGFVPIIGLLPAVYAVSYWRQVSKHYGKQWNPARRYLLGGLLLATVGILGSALILVAFLFAIAQG